MLGRFLEVSLVTRDTGSAWQRWLGLGFAIAEAGDVWPHAYGVVTCEGLAIGLHAAGDEPFVVTFVRPEVAQLERDLATRMIGMERVQTGAHVFNLLELREPGGTLLRVQEARSFSMPQVPPQSTALGRFRALSLPVADLAEARGFWERLDRDVHDIFDPWEGIAIDGLPLLCHPAEFLDEPALLFDLAGDDLDDEALRREVLGAAHALPALRRRRHRLLRTPERLALLLLDPPE
jgi:hypothetical protein